MKRIRGNTHVVYNLVSHLLLSLRLQKKKAGLEQPDFRLKGIVALPLNRLEDLIRNTKFTNRGIEMN